MPTRTFRVVTLPALALLACAPIAGRDSLPLDSIRLPPGFRISLFASGVREARSMALGANGTLFVGSRTAGNVYAILDTDRDHEADRVVTIATGLSMPNGVAFRDGALYVAEINRVWRFDGIEGVPTSAAAAHPALRGITYRVNGLDR